MSKKHRVLIVRNAFKFDFGGGERYPVNLALELQKNDLEPIVASSHRKILQLAGDEGVSNIYMPWLRNQSFSGLRILLFPLYMLWQVRLLFWYIWVIKSKQIDALHLQSRDDFIAGTLAGWLLKKNVVWTDHADLKYLFKNIEVIYKNPIAKILYSVSKYATAIIIVSKNEQYLIEESLKGRALRNTVLIYNGITDRAVVPKRNFPANTVIFSLTSRLVDAKGISEVLTASKLLDIDGVNHKVLLIGEGPDETKYKEVAGKSIIFMGYPQDALSYVAGSDIFIHPTYNEAFSLSLVESAMIGMPVIATDVGGNPEIITHRKTGILIKSRDDNSLYEAMKSMIDHPNTAKKYGINLRSEYLLHFQFNLIVKNQIAPLYQIKK